MNKLSSADSIRTNQTPEPIVVEHDPKIDAMLGFTPPVQQEKKDGYDFPTEIIDLPSRGLLYPKEHPLSSGKIEIKYMTAKEEDILTTQTYIRQGVVLDKLCEAIIVTSGVKFDDILVGDKNAILMAARAYGYGPQYDTRIKTETGTEIPVSINLAELPYKQFDETLITPGINRFKYTLPKSGKTVEFKLLTNGDQKIIDADVKGVQKYNSNAPSRNLTLRMRHMILSVDGDETKSTITKFIDNMLAYDSRALREYISTIQPDVDIEIEEVDPETGETFRANFEIGIDLFYPNYKK
jgi:hypothetical protein